MERNSGVLVCYLCNKQLFLHEDCLEHKTPPWRGGKNSLDNLDVAHKSCNRMKGGRTYEECLMANLFGGIHG